MISAVSRARRSGELTTMSHGSAASAEAATRACSRPVSLRGMSLRPCMRSARFQSVCPWRMRAMSTGSSLGEGSWADAAPQPFGVNTEEISVYCTDVADAPREHDGHIQPVRRVKETTMTDTTLPTQTDADRALKTKHRAMWASGDYPTLASDLIWELGPRAVAAADVRP